MSSQSTYRELSVQGWFTNEHYVLFFTAFPASNPVIGQYLQTLNALGYRIICVHYLLEYQFLAEKEQREADNQFVKYVDHYYTVPAKMSLLDADQYLVNKHIDDWCREEVVQEVKKVCCKFSITVCFVTHGFFSLVFEDLPTRIRKVLISCNSFFDRTMNTCMKRDTKSSLFYLSEGGERLACQRADAVVTTSQSDYVLAQRLLPQKEVYWLPVDRKNDRLHGKINPMQVMQKLLARPFVVPDEAQDHFLHYHDVMIKYLYRYIKNPDDKVFVEIGPDDYLSLARTLKANGAARVIVLQTLQALQKLPQKYNDLPAGVEYQVVSPTSWKNIKDVSVDVIYGVGVLEHITHFEEIVCEIYRVLKPGGRVLLQGGPLWGSPHGHHMVVKDAETGKIKYDFTQPDKNPIEPWMHLVLTEQEMKEKLVQNNISAQYAHKIVDMIYHSDIGSNKKLVDEIVPVFKKKLNVEAVRYLGCTEKNEYYQIARERYSEKDLETDCFIIYAQKKIDDYIVPNRSIHGTISANILLNYLLLLVPSALTFQHFL